MRVISPGGFSGLSHAPSLRAAPRTATKVMSAEATDAPTRHRRPARGSASSGDRPPGPHPCALAVTRAGVSRGPVRQRHRQVRGHARLAAGQGAQPERGLVEQRGKGHGGEVAALGARSAGPGSTPRRRTSSSKRSRARRPAGLSSPQTKQVLETGRGIPRWSSASARPRGSPARPREGRPRRPTLHEDGGAIGDAVRRRPVRRVASRVSGTPRGTRRR